MKKMSFIRRLALVFIVAISMLFAVGVDINCNGTQKQSTHTCLYTLNGSIKTLQHLKDDEPHDIEAELREWKTDRTADAPFVQAYAMTYDYALAADATITLGQNVYVSICTYTAELTFTEDQIVLSKDENGVVNSGFVVHSCVYHGCFAAMEAAVKLTECQVKMGYYLALQNEGTSFVLPAGSYVLAEYFEFSSYVANGQVTFADPANTTVCFNNLITSATDPEVLALKNRGVTVYVECVEDKPAPATHSCAYTQGLDPMPLTQELFDSIVAETQASSTPASDEDPLQNFFYAFLTEDIYCDAALSVPEGMYFGVCKNGFSFDVPALQNVYVFDCEPHVCVYTNLLEAVPLWQAGLDIYSKYATAAGVDFVLPEGMYALMEDVDFTAFPNFLSATGEYAICQNGHTATGLTIPAENEQCFVFDCTQSVEDKGMLVHTCTEINNHITPLYITDALLAGIKGSDGSFALPDGASEIALALPTSVEIDGTMVIPTGVKMYLCLNGFTISGTKSLAQNEDSPYMFKVEYGAELYICDCSAEKTGALISATMEMIAGVTEGEPPINIYASPVYNLGVTELDGVALEGVTGFFNAGLLVTNDASIKGIYMGVMINEADAYEDPLHSVKPSLQTKGSTISGAFSGILKLGGEAALTDTTVNATAFAILSDIDLLDLNEETYRGGLVLDNVTVNLTTVYPEVDETVLALIRSFGMLSAIMGDSNVAIEGNLVINVEEWLLAPYIKEDDNVLTQMYVAEFILGTNSYFDIADGVKLTDDYRVYISNEFTEDFVLANQDMSENFILMEGLVGMVNEKGEYVVLNPSDCGFASNAIVEDVSVGFDGYVCLDFYCKFDVNAEEESFLENDNANVIFNIAGQKIIIQPNEMESLGENLYVYSVNFYPKDYQDKIYVQFNNGKYTWTGIMAISVEDFLELTLLSLEMSLSEVESVLSNSSATETDIATAEENKKELIAYKNVVLGMLNFCGVTTEYFYKVEYQLLENAFAQQEIEFSVDETTQETTEQEVWTETSIATAMDAVTADTLKDYAPQIKDGSVLPANVEFIGASLILNSGTFIRFYFKATQEALQGVTVTINGSVIVPTLYNRSENIYYVQVENLSALQLKTMYEMVLTDGESEYSVSYGVFSYMYGVLNDSDASEALVLVAKATWLYADEADKTVQILSKSTTDNDEEVESNDEA